MKPDKGIEMLTPAWNRYVDIWKKSRQDKMPLRIRGYSELAMTSLHPTDRKQIHSAVKRGYKLARASRAAMLLNLLLKTEDYDISYVGKTNAYIWLPTKEMRDECMEHVEAMSVMTDKFNANRSIRVHGEKSFNIWVLSKQGAQLKQHLKETRLVVDEYMAQWADDRKRLADRIIDDDWICRIPFDSVGD